MSDIVFREAVPRDTPGIVALLGEIMDHHGVTAPPLAELDDVVSRILAAPQHTFFLAVAGTRVVGMCALLFSLSTWRAVEVCEFQDVVVAEKERSSGVGRRLLAAALDFARERGCAWAFLTAESWNLSAHTFYRSQGFQEKAVMYFEYDLGGQRERS